MSEVLTPPLKSYKTPVSPTWCGNASLHELLRRQNLASGIPPDCWKPCVVDNACQSGGAPAGQDVGGKGGGCLRLPMLLSYFRDLLSMRRPVSAIRHRNS
jgi:hypothetical protein